jgi:hypothetical protein
MGTDTMAIKTIRCHVLQSTISMVTDFEDSVVQVICPEYDNATGMCRLKTRASSGGPLSTFVARASEGTLDNRAVRCDFGARR